MAKYLIHCCEKRKWYVDKFLVPSMLKQGINQDDILIYNDTLKQGNLKSFIKSAELLANKDFGTWHLQDDIIISSKFKEMTEKYDTGIVCAFCNNYSGDLPMGIRPVRDMWYSFPCIRIPNYILRDFISWLVSPSVQSKYRAYIEANKFDDSLFRIYMLKHRPQDMINNLYPNIVDNVDYLIGGSLINYRKKDCDVNSLYFNEKILKENLSRELSQTYLQE